MKQLFFCSYSTKNKTISIKTIFKAHFNAWFDCFLKTFLHFFGAIRPRVPKSSNCVRLLTIRCIFNSSYYLFMYIVPLLWRGRTERLDRQERRCHPSLVLPGGRRSGNHVLQDGSLEGRLPAEVHQFSQG